MTDVEPPPADDAPAPAPRVEPRDGFARLAIFLIVTLAIATLTATSFVRVPQTVAAQGGNRLDQAATTVVDKIILISQWDVLRPYAHALLETPGSLLETYDERTRQLAADLHAVEDETTPPGDDRLQRQGDLEAALASTRTRQIILLALLGERDAAARVADALATQPTGADTASALRDAFTLGPKTSAAASSLPHERVTRDFAALEAVEGWPGLAAQCALARRINDAPRANTLDAALQDRARSVARQLATIGTIVGLDFFLGLAVLLVWLLRGRTWNLRAVDTDLMRPPPSACFDPLAGWSTLLAFQLTAPIVGGIVGGLMSARTGSVAVGGSVLAVTGTQLLIYAITIGFIGAAIRFRWSAIGLHTKHLLRSALAGLFLFWGGFIVVLATSWLMSTIFHSSNAQNNPVFKLIETAAGGGMQTAIMLMLVAFIGPVFEEILFRGVLYTSMRRVLSAPVAIVLNGLLFSAIHGDTNTLLPLATLGMLLAYGFERTRSLATSAVCHCLWNGQTFALFLLLFS